MSSIEGRSLSSKFIHSLPFSRKRKLPRIAVGPSPGRAQRARGSLDGWPRCQIVRDEGMAGYLVLALTSKGPRLIAPLPFALF